MSASLTQAEPTVFNKSTNSSDAFPLSGLTHGKLGHLFCLYSTSNLHLLLELTASCVVMKKGSLLA